MTPQIEKTYPAGANNVGYESDTSAVVLPFKGRALANAFTIMVSRKAPMLATFSNLNRFESDTISEFLGKELYDFIGRLFD